MILFLYIIKYTSKIYLVHCLVTSPYVNSLRPYSLTLRPQLYFFYPSIIDLFRYRWILLLKYFHVRFIFCLWTELRREWSNSGGWGDLSLIEWETWTKLILWPNYSDTPWESLRMTAFPLRLHLNNKFMKTKL